MQNHLEYDTRYLAGILLFNRADFYNAHEVWEDLWTDCPSADRRFYQSLIQAAVALYHGLRRNATGANRLCVSGHRYMLPYAPEHLGLNVVNFWSNVQFALATILNVSPEAASQVRLPTIALDPHPSEWPNDDVVTGLLGSHENGHN